MPSTSVGRCERCLLRGGLPSSRSLRCWLLVRSGQRSGTVSNGPKRGIEPSVKAVVGGAACADAVVGVRADLRDVGGSVSGDTGSEQPCQR